MNVIRSAIICSDCKNVLQKPIVMPCGESVCLRHVENVTDIAYNCKSCGHEHKNDEYKLLINKALEKLMAANLNKIDLFITSYGDNYRQAYDHCQKLNDLINEFDALKKDPCLFIHDTIARLKNQAELIREEYKLVIDTKTKTIIDELDEYERECNSKLELNEFKSSIEEIEDDLANIKQDLRLWEKQISVFDSTQNDLSTISVKSQVHIASLKTKSEVLKEQLLMQNFRQYYEKLEKFSQIEKCFEKKQYSLRKSIDRLSLYHYIFLINNQIFKSLIEEFKILFESVAPFGNSKIINSVKLQIDLINLCQLDQLKKFTLLYQASEHGFTAKNFHSKCDNQPNTLTIIRSSNGNIFGGFIDVTWESSIKWKRSENSFIFSLINQSKNPFKIKIDSNSSSNAIYCNQSYGPSFGGGHDIFIADCTNTRSTSYSNFSYSYKHQNYSYGSVDAKSILAGSWNFTVSDIEVYRLD